MAQFEIARFRYIKKGEGPLVLTEVNTDVPVKLDTIIVPMNIANNSGETLKEKLADAINNRPTFFSPQAKLLLFQLSAFVAGTFYYTRFQLKDVGRFYGAGTSTIDKNDILQYGFSETIPEDEIPTVDIGDIVNTPILTAVNSLDPSRSIARTNIVKATQRDNDNNPIVNRYYFNGQDGDYGLGKDQAEEDDLVLIPNEIDDSFVERSQPFNLAMGNVGEVINTKTKLANNFTFTVNDILSFSIINNNVFALISNTDYKNENSPKWQAEDFKDKMTFLIETDGFWKRTSNVGFCDNFSELIYVDLKIERLDSDFFNCTKLEADKIRLNELRILSSNNAFRNLSNNTFDNVLSLPNLELIDSGGSFRDSVFKIYTPKLSNVTSIAFSGYIGTEIYAPKLKQLGPNVDADLPTANNVFNSVGLVNGPCEITLHHSLETVNNGDPDTDILVAISNGNKIVYAGKNNYNLSQITDDTKGLQESLKDYVRLQSANGNTYKLTVGNLGNVTATQE